MGSSDVESNLTLAPDFDLISAIFFSIKEAGLHVTVIALKKRFVDSQCDLYDHAFPVADFMTSSFLTAYSVLWPWLVFPTEGDIFSTEKTASLSEAIKSNSFLAVISESSSTTPTSLLELQHQAKWPFLLQFLYILFSAGQDSL